ncbi:hypothetical protein GCM10009665_38920 [Kitasatospora nipponensis]|uniref:OmpR/PhoB-type domain-containing protein n=1 Tax=Kitasatospora nipponensis TaxID=258049 RepID=A0ABN1WCC8_9ACTN
MEFGILGPLLVHDGHEVRAVPAAKQRVLLAALLVRPGQLVPAGLLAELLWDGTPPPTAATTLRNYVMRLRHRLGLAADRLETHGGGYRLRVAPGELDVQRFTGLRDAGAAALREGNCERASRQLADALALWRGPGLVDVPSDALHREEADRLAELRLGARELRLDAELRLGRHLTATAELQALTAAHPERERFWAQLMIALHLGGRQSEALAVFQRVRRMLAADVGVDPGAELREVHRRILDGAPALSALPVRPGPGPVADTAAGATAGAGAAAVLGAALRVAAAGRCLTFTVLRSWLPVVCAPSPQASVSRPISCSSRGASGERATRKRKRAARPSSRCRASEVVTASTTGPQYALIGSCCHCPPLITCTVTSLTRSGLPSLA